MAMAKRPCLSSLTEPSSLFVFNSTSRDEDRIDASDGGKTTTTDEGKRLPTTVRRREKWSQLIAPILSIAFTYCGAVDKLRRIEMVCKVWQGISLSGGGWSHVVLSARMCKLV